MKRMLSIAAAAALLVALLPIGAVAAHDSDNQGNGHGDKGHPGKITICHNPNGAHPVTIRVSLRSWTAKAHMKHGDFVVTSQTPCVPKPKPPKPASGQCTFVGTAQYVRVPPSTGVSAGPLTFSWDASTGTVSGGSWDEVSGGVHYLASINGGTIGAGTASLAFLYPPSFTYSFAGTFTQPAGQPWTLSGALGPTPPQPAGNQFTATGTRTCSQPTTPPVCTFDGAANYYNGATTSGALLSTGPIRFSWDASTGTVRSGGYWHENGYNYTDSILSGSVTGPATPKAVSLAFSRTVGPALTFSFVPGTLTNGTTLLGSLAGAGQPVPNTFQAIGATTCTQTSQKHGDHEDDD